MFSRKGYWNAYQRTASSTARCIACCPTFCLVTYSVNERRVLGLGHPSCSTRRFVSSELRSPLSSLPLVPENENAAGLYKG
jgi:hypothetical protein